MSSRRIGKYACLEIERRYLLKVVPEDLPPNGWRITDRYFPGTRLRLRQMKSKSTDEEVYKLTQKYRAPSQDAVEITITNLYLTRAEYNLLNALPANIVRKMRYRYRIENRELSIDVFEGRRQGLVLAEAEFENTAEAAAFEAPSFAIRDVTDDPFFTGGHLASLTDEEFQQRLPEYLHGQDLSA